MICEMVTMGQVQVKQQRIYSAEGRYYIEQEELRNNDWKFIKNTLTLYQNEPVAKMIWSREFSEANHIYISKTAKRVVIFYEEWRSDCKSPVFLTILDEHGRILKKYQDSELGFELICAGKIGEGADTVWDGVVRFSDDDKVLEVGSIRRVNDEILLDNINLREKCGGYYSCQDKGTPLAQEWLPDKVWQIDLVTGLLLTMAETEEIGKTLDFPSPQRYAELKIDEGNHYSSNKQYELQISSQKDLILFDSHQMEKPLWKSRLSFMPQGWISGKITDDGKRVILQVYPVQLYELAQSKALIFLDEKGQVIKEYKLGELVDSSRVFWTSNKYFRWSFIKQITGNILYLKVFRVSDSMDQLVARNIRGETIGIRDPDLLLAQDELLSFDLTTGRLIERKKIQPVK